MLLQTLVCSRDEVVVASEVQFNSRPQKPSKRDRLLRLKPGHFILRRSFCAQNSAAKIEVLSPARLPVALNLDLLAVGNTVIILKSP